MNRQAHGTTNGPLADRLRSIDNERQLQTRYPDRDFGSMVGKPGRAAGGWIGLPESLQFPIAYLADPFRRGCQSLSKGSGDSSITRNG